MGPRVVRNVRSHRARRLAQVCSDARRVRMAKKRRKATAKKAAKKVAKKTRKAAKKVAKKARKAAKKVGKKKVVRKKK